MGTTNPYTLASSLDLEDIARASPPLSEDQIILNLRDRFFQGKVATQLGDRALIVVNPLKPIPAWSETASKEWAQWAKDGVVKRNPQTEEPLAHIFGLAEAVFQRLRLGEDQSIILLGESGSGKSESARWIARHLCDLSKGSKKKSKVHSAILKVDSILNAFGSAQTKANRSASRFGRYAEYQFDARGKMVGLKLLDCLLEHSRVACLPEGERNFEVFYQLLAGATPEERTAWKIGDTALFPHLSHSKFVSLAADDKIAFSDLVQNLKALGIGRRQQSQAFQVLAAILHLSTISFVSDPSQVNEPCRIRNPEQLDHVAELLGLSSADLQNLLIYKTKRIDHDFYSAILDAEGAVTQCNDIAKSLYLLLFSWIVERLNIKLCKDESEWSNFVSIVDFPGIAGLDQVVSEYYQLLANFSAELVQSIVLEQLVQYPRELLLSEGLESPEVPLKTNVDLISAVMLDQPSVLSIIHSGKEVSPTETAGAVLSLKTKHHSLLESNKTRHGFAIRHYCGQVDYDSNVFDRRSKLDTMHSEIIDTFVGTAGQGGSVNPFLRDLFSTQALLKFSHPVDSEANVKARKRKTQLRSPSSKKHLDTGDEAEENGDNGLEQRMLQTLRDILDTASLTKSWFVFHINPSPNPRTMAKFDVETVKRQVRYFGLHVLSKSNALYYASFPTHEEIRDRYGLVLRDLDIVDEISSPASEAVKQLVQHLGWRDSDVAVGRTRLFLSTSAYMALEDHLKVVEAMDVPESEYSDGAETEAFETESHFGSEIAYPPGAAVPLRGFGRQKGTTDYEKLDGSASRSPTKLGKGEPNETSQPFRELSKARRSWLCCTWCLTWWIPSLFLSTCGGMKRKDIQIAWREKVALFIIIILMCATILFFIIGVGLILCPKVNMLSEGEITIRNTTSNPYVIVYGNYYKIDNVVKSHVVTSQWLGAQAFAATTLGQDVSAMFFKTQFASTYCPGFTLPPGWDNLKTRSPPAAFETVWYSHIYDSNHNLLDYVNQISYMMKGQVARDSTWLQNFISADPQNNRVIVAYGRVYDISNYYDPSNVPSSTASGFLGAQVKQIFDMYGQGNMAGKDSTALFELLKKPQYGGPAVYSKVRACMDGLFYTGVVDTRNSMACRFSNTILLVASIILVSVIGFKFLAALQFGSSHVPEDQDRFVICQVPCYTEGAESLSTTLESLAKLKYDDRRKLLFVIADGMIIGGGNDRPTPRIVLDVLGVPADVNPTAQSFQSLGEGNKQLNYAKVYSGLYHLEGHHVPFIVVVKVGKPSEKSRPGNRGKRDSQMILMRFLSRVHYNEPMNPLELELFYHIKNIIGVHPSLYEYLFMIDADTEVMPDSLNRMISAMVRDSRIMGICGETQLSNEKDSWVTMIQVYEYFISHHMAKAFESLFGSVTCLPGCFCMYRVRTPTNNMALLVSHGVIEDYAVNEVNTLHLKNLLHLGEDRYLTTLMLKHFPQMKTKFTQDAICKTGAPDRWDVLLSQRRRWINSTVHNLFELLFLPQLCGFCCFSMRFVVFLDLIATFIQPAALVYIAYLVYTLTTDDTAVFPLISIIMLGAIYGFQVIIFIMKQEWQHIGWMIFYVVAIPIFSFYVPLYSFWHFDDFSWGNTRVVLGEGKKAIYVAESEEFDPSVIPLRTWEEYQQEILEAQANATQANRFSMDSDTQRSVQHCFDSPQTIPPAYTYTRTALDTRSNIEVVRSTTSEYGCVDRGIEPSDDEVVMEIHQILAASDLMSVTKKDVLRQLNARFGVDLGWRKQFIHATIDSILRSQP
ncbi:chitin synthase-domain-containing protein [Polychytrium aggregatum]|uniref:chitin synthase-domain-containing protein n=1 Tax=Polychytrium aggregatum TaxID=110093 RepID=UPI0022FDD7B7|nr:chitin synthase-domain-containing protein [Polychytrium aggregatum]KAI9206842.1 chitin synthase-domain-containing protein [Polychytrium aggregatum]